MRRLTSSIKQFLFRIKIGKLRKRIGKLGKGSIIDGSYYFTIAENIFIEDFVYIGPGAIIQSYDHVVIKRGTIIGPRVKIYSANHQFRDAELLPYDKGLDKRKVLIDENVWIGGDVIIVPGATIEEGAIIGAGSVVAGVVEKGSIVAGNPARKIGERNMNHYLSLKEKDMIYLKNKLDKSLG